MSFLTWLPGVLKTADVPIFVLPGAETRSTRESGLTVEGVVWHHTATGTNWLDGHVAALLRDGRRDLSGPLAPVGIERDGTWVIVALGRCNHNGYGEWGNDSLGLEFYNDGVGEPFTEEQMRTGVAGTAAVLKYLGLPVDRVKGHKETDPGRKIDPLRDMAGVRGDVWTAMYNTKPTPPSAPEPKEEEEMTYFTYEYKHTSGATILVLVHHGQQVALTGNDLLAERRALGQPHHLVVQADETARFTNKYGPSA